MKKIHIRLLILLIPLFTAGSPAAGDHPLHRAAMAGDLETLTALISQGTDVNLADHQGNTPLQLAAFRGHISIVDKLLASGATLPKAVESRQRMLLWSCRSGMEALARRLLALDGWKTARNANGGTILHEAAAGGHPGILSILLQRGMDVSRKDRNGWTPLHYAASRGRGSAILVLLRRGADPDTRTIAGLQAVTLARLHGHDITADLLVRKGAETSPREFPRMSGPWMGQAPPGNIPRIFAPGIVSGHYAVHGSIAFSRDGRMAAWRPMGPRGGTILIARMNQDIWKAPKHLFPPGPLSAAGSPSFSPEGNLLFLSPRNSREARRIEMVRVNEQGWSAPIPLEFPTGSPPPAGAFSLDAEGNLFFASQSVFFVSAYANGAYRMPEKIDIDAPPGATDPGISPDGTILLFSATGKDNLDIFVSFRKSPDRWSRPQALTPPVNSSGMEMCPRFSPRGEFIFFTRWHERVHGVYWVSATVIPEPET